jgi:GNAT superfamily N-acetyltransferase
MIKANQVIPEHTNDVTVRIATFDDEPVINAIYNEANINALNIFIESNFGSPLRLWLMAIACIAVGLLLPYAVEMLYVGYILTLVAAIVTFFPRLFYTSHTFLAADFQQGIVEYYAHEDRMLFVAEVNRVVVGMVGIAPPTEIDKSGHFRGLRKEGDAELSRMAISKLATGRGISKHLLNKAKLYCEEKGFKRMVLTTSTAQEVACKYLYPSFGFKVEKKFNVWWFGGIIDSVFFAYSLENKQK